ncbi:MAG: threonine synthase [Candidatus Aenigmarchaeota archaeon]|nr:threonine synthase [Candidatus Aenigmarchaeota archaeon]
MNNITTFECAACKQKTTTQYKCSCSSPVSAVHRAPKTSWQTLRAKKFGHWRYSDFLPEVLRKITLDEGHTPLVQQGNLFFKLESCNPTGSFKDRGSTVEISLANKSVVCASTGNMGASVAAYCAKAKLDCTIVLPKNTPEQKVRQIKIFGAAIEKVEGHYTHAVEHAAKSAHHKNMRLAGDYALRREGEKTIVFEIIDQINCAPDRIICPMGNGTLISAIWQGVLDFKTAGLIKKLPQLVGVQAAGCSPIADAFHNQMPIKAVNPKTIASAVACGNPLDGLLAIHSLAQSKGTAMKISDKELLSARRKLAREYGIDGEPSAVLSFAACQKIKQKGKTALIVTGSGLKDLKHI